MKRKHDPGLLEQKSMWVGNLIYGIEIFQ